MNVDSEALNEIFRMQDLLGLLAMGAEDHEYEREVDDVLTAIESLPGEDATEARVLEILEEVYRARFNWSDKQLLRLHPDFAEIASKVVNYFA